MLGTKNFGIKPSPVHPHKKNTFRRSIATVLLYSQLMQIAGAAVAPTAPTLPPSSSYFQNNKPAITTPISAGALTPFINYAQTGVWNNLSLNNQQLAIYSPLD